MFAQPQANNMQALGQGNPAPMAQVGAPQQKPQSGMPPDMLEMIKQAALLEQQKAAQNYQAINAYAQQQQQPTVAQQLQQAVQQSGMHKTAEHVAPGLQAKDQQQRTGIQQLLGAGAPVPQGIAAADPGPQSFADGGIVGYDDGGDVVDTKQYKDAPGDTVNDRDYKAAMRAKIAIAQGAARDKSQGDSAARTRSNLGKWIGSLLNSQPDIYSHEGRGATSPTDMPAIAGTAAADTPDTTWTGTRLSPAQVSAMQQSNDPEQQAAAAAYGRWAASQPAPAATTAPAPGYGGENTGNTASERTRETVSMPAPRTTLPAPRGGLETILSDYVTKQLGTDPSATEDARAAKYKAMVGAPDTSAAEAQMADLAERKKRFAPQSGIMDLLRQYANKGQPGDQWWQTGARGGQGLIDENAQRAAAVDALSDKGYALQQSTADAKRAFGKEQFSVGDKGRTEALGQQEKAATAGASMYGSDAHVRAAEIAADPRYQSAMAQLERAQAAGDKNAAAEAIANMKALLSADKELVESINKKSIVDKTPEDAKAAAAAQRRIAAVSGELMKRLNIPAEDGFRRDAAPPAKIRAF